MNCGQCKYYLEGTCYRFPPYGGKSRSRVSKDEVPCGEFHGKRPGYVRADHIPKPKEQTVAAPTSKIETAVTKTSSTTTGTGE
jgi:hypothetical protein